MRYYQGKIPAKLKEVQELNLEEIAQPEDYNQALLKILASPNICSKEWVCKDNKKQMLKVLKSYYFRETMRAY